MFGPDVTFDWVLIIRKLNSVCGIQPEVKAVFVLLPMTHGLSFCFSGHMIVIEITQAQPLINVIVTTDETMTAMIVIVTTMIVIAITTDIVIRGECSGVCTARGV